MVQRTLRLAARCDKLDMTLRAGWNFDAAMLPNCAETLIS